MMMKKKFKKAMAGILICSMLSPVCGLTGSVSMAKSVEINAETIPDAQIRSLAAGADTNNDGVLSETEAEKVESLWFSDAIDDISQALKIFPKVKNVTFRNVGNTKSIVFNSTKVKDVTLRDCSKMVALKGAAPEKVEVYLRKKAGDVNSANKQKLGDINFAKLAGYSKVTDLTLFNIYSDKLSMGNITLPNTKKMKSVRVYACQFKKMNLSALKNVTSVILTNCGLTNLDVSKNTKLTPDTLKLAENIQLRTISVGKLYDILKMLSEEMVIDDFFNICLVGKPGESYDLKSMIPMLEGYSIGNTENGVLTLPKSDYDYITSVNATTEKRSCYIYFYKK